MAYYQNILKRNKVVPAIPSGAIFDSQYMAKYMLAGTMPASSKPQRWYDEGYLKKAESLAELARLIGAQPPVLEATVARFNGFVVNNRDEDFQRGVRAYDNWLGDPLHSPSMTLGSIDKPPFHAITVVPGAGCSIGPGFTFGYIAAKHAIGHSQVKR